MAGDAAMWEAVGDGNQLPTVRIYRWRPSISVGRHQDVSLLSDLPDTLPVVRRPTGGRAVVHGGDLTISVAARCGRDGAGRTVREDYRLLATPVVDAWAKRGVSLAFGKPSSVVNCECDCFKNIESCDIVDSETRKVIGSAQRRSKTAVLLQMSVRPCGGIDPVRDDYFIRCLREAYSHSLGIMYWEAEFELSETEREHASILSQSNIVRNTDGE
jgi:lipoate-protein ligase A